MEKMVNFSKYCDVKFLKKLKSCPQAQQNTLLSISPDQYSKVLYILFLLFAKLRTIESD